MSLTYTNSPWQGKHEEVLLQTQGIASEQLYAISLIHFGTEQGEVFFYLSYLRAVLNRELLRT